MSAELIKLPDIKKSTDTAGYTKSLNPSSSYNYSLCDDSKKKQWFLSIEVFQGQSNRRKYYQYNSLPYSDASSYASQYELGKIILERQFPVKFRNAYSCPYKTCEAHYQPEDETWDHIKEWHSDCTKIPLDKQTVEQRSEEHYKETLGFNGQTVVDEIKKNNTNNNNNFQVKEEQSIKNKSRNRSRSSAENQLFRKRNKLSGRYPCHDCNLNCKDSEALNRHLETQTHSVKSNRNKRIKLEKQKQDSLMLLF